MDWSPIINWIPTEAGAAWVIPIICGLSAAFLWVRDRFIPQSLVFSEISSSSLLDIDNSVAEHLTVKLGDTPISNLSGIRAELYNAGSTVISNGSLTIEAREPSAILSLAAKTSDGNCKIKTYNNAKRAKIEFEYLNPFRKHNHTIAISLSLIGSQDDWQVTGGGKDWSLNAKKLGKRKDIAEIITILSGLVILGITLTTLLIFIFNPTEKPINHLPQPWPVILLVIGMVMGIVCPTLLRRYTNPVAKSQKGLVDSLRFIEQNEPSTSISVVNEKNKRALIERFKSQGAITSRFHQSP